jgi:hypothetical protein
MKQTIKIRNIFDIDKLRLVPDDNPLTKSEKETLILPRNEKNKIQYEKFDTDFMLYLMKVPQSAAKKSVDRMFNNKLVFLGTDTKRDGSIGGPLVSEGEKLGGVVLDAADLEINLSEGETSNIDLAFYAAYFNYIRGVVLIKRREVKQNKELSNLIVSYLKNLLKKAISISTLNPKQEIIYEALVRQFYYQHMLYYDFGFAMEFTIKEVPSELQDEVNELFRTSEMNRYQQFRDIFKALFDLKIVAEPPNKMLGTALTKLGMSQFLYATAVADYLIAAAIVSNYPAATFVKALSVNRNAQEQIEKIIIGYGNSLKYDSELVRGL